MTGGLDALKIAVEEWLAWSKRHKALRETVRRTIEAEGGQVDRISMIGFLLKSPFPPINVLPVYLKAFCFYPNDTGIWYNCGTDRGDTHWVWSSGTGAIVPPVERGGSVKVDNCVIALPVGISILLYLLFMLGLGVLLVYLFVYA
jgi:hypothetical protein